MMFAIDVVQIVVKGILLSPLDFWIQIITIKTAGGVTKVYDRFSYEAVQFLRLEFRCVLQRPWGASRPCFCCSHIFPEPTSTIISKSMIC